MKNENDEHIYIFFSVYTLFFIDTDQWLNWTNIIKSTNILK